MPIHDWTRVSDCLVHDFQLGWIGELCRRLNHGVLPSSHFAMSETIDLRPPVGFCRLPEPDQPFSVPDNGAELHFADECPPQTRLTMKRDRVEYATRVVTIRDGDTHAVVAAILPVSQQDKQIGYRWESFLQHAVGALLHGIHLLVIDLFPPTSRDPQGIHKAIWERLADEPFVLPFDKPLTLASYASEREMVACIEPVAVGDPLPDMPIFLTPNQYVLCPLEATYQAAWDVLPAVLKGPLERV